MSIRSYKPRRQSARWLDGDCPKGVLAIYDDPRSADRFTIFYVPDNPRGLGDWIDYRAASVDPFAPHGIGIYGQMRAYEVAQYRYAVRHRAAKWSSLPDDVQRLVHRDLTPDPA